MEFLIGFLLSTAIGLFFLFNYLLVWCADSRRYHVSFWWCHCGALSENVNSHLMLLVSMIGGVLAGDSCMYWLGRIYGTKILRFRQYVGS